MRLSMVMIARNEHENVRPCFDSFWDHVDEVVLCDTGSRDGTIGEARRYARERGGDRKLVVGRFKWCDDFFAARNHAHSLATGDVHTWIDLDDRLIGGPALRAQAARLIDDPDLVTLLALWSGPITPEQWRARFLRPPLHWEGPTWEAAVRAGGHKLADELRWHHTRTVPRGRRDLDLALRWAEREPNNWRPLEAAADEALGLAAVPWRTVISCCREGLAVRDAPPQVRAHFCLMWARALYASGQSLEAEAMARVSIGWGRMRIRANHERDENAERQQYDLGGLIFDAWQLAAKCALGRDDPEEALRCTVESASFACTSAKLDEAQESRSHALHAIGEFIVTHQLPAEDATRLIQRAFALAGAGEPKDLAAAL